MEKSYRQVGMCRYLGENFTITLIEGYSKPLVVIADLTRALVSRTAVSASPTRNSLVKQRCTPVSTLTSGASMHSLVLKKVVATFLNQLYPR